MRRPVYDALPGRVVCDGGRSTRLGTRRALLVDLPRPMTASMGFMRIRTRAPARVADGQLQAILADVFEPRRLSLDHEVERFTHVQPGRLRRGQQTRRSTGG